MNINHLRIMSIPSKDTSTDISKDTIIHQDCSTVSKYLKLWWNFVADLVPPSISPNLITFTGGFFMICSIILSFISRESWTLLFHSLAIFVFQTLDAIDGIQARKILASSKLGNFIDHYTDVFSLQIMFHIVLLTLDVTNNLLYALAMVFVNYSIFVTHWETVRTNILYFTDGFSITEFQLIAIIIHLIGYVFPNFWINRTFYLSLGEIFISGLIILNVIFVIIPLLKRVIEKCGIEVLWSLFWVTLMAVISVLWIYYLPTTEIIRSVMITLPFTYLIGDMLIDFLYTRSDPVILFVSPYVFQIVVLLFNDSTLWKLCTLVLFCLTIYQYFSAIYRMSKEFNIPIIGLKNKS